MPTETMARSAVASLTSTLLAVVRGLYPDRSEHSVLCTALVYARRVVIAVEDRLDAIPAPVVQEHRE